MSADIGDHTVYFMYSSFFNCLAVVGHQMHMINLPDVKGVMSWLYFSDRRCNRIGLEIGN